MNLEKLNEGDEKPDGDGDGVPPWVDKDDDDPKVQEEGIEEDEELEEQSKSDLPDRGGRRAQGGRRLDEEDDEEVVEEEFPGKRDMDQHKSDLSESRLKEIIAYALKTRG